MKPELVMVGQEVQGMGQVLCSGEKHPNGRVCASYLASVPTGAVLLAHLRKGAALDGSEGDCWGLRCIRCGTTSVFRQAGKMEKIPLRLWDKMQRRAEAAGGLGESFDAKGETDGTM